MGNDMIAMLRDQHRMSAALARPVPVLRIGINGRAARSIVIVWHEPADPLVSSISIPG